MENQALRIILAFLIGLVIIFITARIIGEDRKAKWFKKREKRSIFIRRGFLGETWHFGVPRSYQGVLIMTAMYALIGIIGYWLIFVFQ